MNISSLSVIFLLSAFALTTSCSTTSGTKPENTVDGHNSQNSLDWAGVYTGAATLLTLDKDQTYSLEEKISADSISRQTGTFSWDTDGRNIRLSEIGKQYWVRENNIILLDDDNTAIPSGELTKEAPVLSGVYWRLVEINGKDAADLKSGLDREAYLQFDSARSMVSGNSGCNQIFGAYEADGTSGKIKFGQLGSTMMMCPSMELEREFTETIVLPTTYEIDGGTLLLKDKDGETLFTFKRALFKE